MVLGQLKEKADLVAETFNSLEGMSCNPVQGAMYAFPQIKMPQAAIEAAKVITVGLQISGRQISRFFSLLTIFFGNRFFLRYFVINPEFHVLDPDGLFLPQNIV